MRQAQSSQSLANLPRECVALTEQEGLQDLTAASVLDHRQCLLQSCAERREQTGGKRSRLLDLEETTTLQGEGPSARFYGRIVPQAGRSSQVATTSQALPGKGAVVSLDADAQRLGPEHDLLRLVEVVDPGICLPSVVSLLPFAGQNSADQERTLDVDWRRRNSVEICASPDS